MKMTLNRALGRRNGKPAAPEQTAGTEHVVEPGSPEAAVLAALDETPRRLADVAKRAGLSTQAATAALLALEIQRQVAQDKGGRGFYRPGNTPDPEPDPPTPEAPAAAAVPSEPQLDVQAIVQQAVEAALEQERARHEAEVAQLRAEQPTTAPAPPEPAAAPPFEGEVERFEADGKVFVVIGDEYQPKARAGQKTPRSIPMLTCAQVYVSKDGEYGYNARRPLYRVSRQKAQRADYLEAVQRVHAIAEGR